MKNKLTAQNGKGKEPEKGRDHKAFRSGYDVIEWGKKKKAVNDGLEIKV